MESFPNTVRSCDVRRKENTDIPVTLEIPTSPRASAGGAFHCVPALLHANNGQGPEIEPVRALIVQFVVELRDGFRGRHAMLEFELADAGVGLGNSACVQPGRDGSPHSSAWLADS
jgi:hypothetical protein